MVISAGVSLRFASAIRLRRANPLRGFRFSVGNRPRIKNKVLKDLFFILVISAGETSSLPSRHQ